jgi:hypothetical protein
VDSQRFDSMTRLLARHSSRRTAIAAAAAAATTPLLVAAQDGTPVAEVATPAATPGADLTADFPVFLFVQTFTQGSWEPGEEGGLYTLTLSGVGSGTIAFSDRPERIVTLVPMQQFLDGLGFTPNNPPNAALVAMRAGDDMSDQEVLVVELFSPAYDAASGILTYKARVLEDYGAIGLAGLAPNQTDSELPESFAGGTLLIDDCSDGDAVCYQELNGEKVIVGNIGDVGCCYDWGAGNCEPCNRDTSSEYYGQLCAENFPDHCSYDGGSWDCFADAVSCPIV